MAKKSNITKPPRENRQSYWESIKEAFGEVPQEVNGQLTARTEYYRSMLYNIAKGRFKIKCPDWWDKDYMLDLLLKAGRFFITDSTVGIAPFDGNSYGLNVFRRPPNVTIVNEVIGTFDRVLTGDGADCVVVYLYDDKYYRTINETVNIYAEKLASCDCSIDVSLINSRVAFVFNAENTKQADEAKLVYDRISSGRPAVFTKVKDPMKDGDDGLSVQAFPAKDALIINELQEAKRAIIGEFLTVVGLNNTAYEKRERLITSEVDSNNDEIECNVKYVKRNLKQCSKRVRKMFGIEFNIKLEGNGNGKKEPKDLYQKGDPEPSGSGGN